MNPDVRRDLAFLQAEFNRLLQQQVLAQQRLDWELQRLEIDLQLLQEAQIRQQHDLDRLLQEAQIRQQHDLDRRLQDDLAADRRAALEQQRAELEQRRAAIEEFREQVQQSRAGLQPELREAPDLVPRELVEDSERPPYSLLDQYDQSRLSAWERQCLWQLEKPDGVHTRMWEQAVLQATGERLGPASDTPQHWYERCKSLQARTQQPDPTYDTSLDTSLER